MRPRGRLGRALLCGLCLVAAAGASADDASETAWKKARALADSGRHDEALGVVRTALRRDPSNTDLLWLEAGVTGWSGRHQESVALYEQLMTNHPEMAGDLRRDLATERLAADDPKGALRDLDLYLAANPADPEARRLRARALAHADRLAEAVAAYDQLLVEDPDDLDVALDRAMVLGWMGKHDQAVAAYDQILRAHPGNTAAREGLARNENLRGNHRRAIVLYEELRRENNPEGAKGLAYAYYYMGEPERAKPILSEYVRERPLDPEALELAEMMEREESHGLTSGYARSDDSDGLRVRTTTVDYRRPLGRQLAVSVRWRRDLVKDAGGNRDPYRITAGFDKRWSERWSGEAYLTLLKPDSQEELVGLGEASLAWRPTDRWRFDAGYSKDAVLTRLSLLRNIRVEAVVLGADWQATERVVLRVAQRLNYYNDENRSTLRSASASGRLWSNDRSRVEAGFSVSHLKTHLDLDNGYYDPERYIEFGPTLELELTPDERWVFAGRGQVGYQKEKGSLAEPFQTLRASVQLPVVQPVALAVEGGVSDSNLSSSSGFRQKRWGIYLTTGF